MIVVLMSFSMKMFPVHADQLGLRTSRQLSVRTTGPAAADARSRNSPDASS
jgi:hypothetical protein